MPMRRSNTSFTVIVGVSLFIGAGVMALLLAFSGAPTGLVVGLVLAAIPVGPLIASYLWLDRYEPEPRSLLLLGLGWGAFVATAIAIFLQTFDEFAFGSDEITSGVIVAPLTEEAAKGLFILLLVWFRRAELDGILDGIVYAGMVGIGFAFTENILYLSAAYIGDDGQTGGLESAVGLFIVRGVFSPFAHPFFTAFIGVGAGLAVVSRSRLLRVLAPLVGFGLAVLAHSLWNATLLLNGGAGAAAGYVLLMAPGFVLFVLFAVWARRREGRLLATALADCSRRGFLHPAEVPWLVRIPGRRTCRRYARRVGGRRALEVVKAYQSEAIELGYLHHRYLRGVAPRDYAALGQRHVERMYLLRPHVLWPQTGGVQR